MGTGLGTGICALLIPGLQPSSVLARAVGDVCLCPPAQWSQLLCVGPFSAILLPLTLPRYEQG